MPLTGVQLTLLELFVVAAWEESETPLLEGDGGLGGAPDSDGGPGPHGGSGGGPGGGADAEGGPGSSGGAGGGPGGCGPWSGGGAPGGGPGGNLCSPLGGSGGVSGGPFTDPAVRQGGKESDEVAAVGAFAAVCCANCFATFLPWR